MAAPDEGHILIPAESAPVVHSAGPPDSNHVRANMRQDWDTRAKENAEYYVASASTAWDRREFFRSGEINVVNEVMPEIYGLCGGVRSSLDLSMLEIGCGVGRMTKMLGRLFGRVIAVDISAQMIKRARSNLRGLENVSLVVGDGATLTAIADASLDFAFSFIVFQHIPSREVIKSYCREVFRVLKPGALFKFQVQGSEFDRGGDPGTWHGVTIAEDDAQRLASETGFTLERSTGAGTQYFWLWFRKPK